MRRAINKKLTLERATTLVADARRTGRKLGACVECACVHAGVRENERNGKCLACEKESVMSVNELLLELCP